MQRDRKGLFQSLYLETSGLTSAVETSHVRKQRLRETKRILALLISLAYWCLRTDYRAISRLAGKKDRTRSVVVLTYHSVTASGVRHFEKQMQTLRRRAKPVFADESTDSDGAKSVAVTFDDALQCVVDRALPILAQHKIPATIFVPTGFLGAEAGWMVPRAGQSGFVDQVVSTTTLASMDGRRVRIGSHTVTHPRLASLEDGQLHSELSVSRGTLEEITGAPVTMLALPYGSFSANVIEAARRAGYQRVFANIPLPRNARGAPLLVGRIDVSPRDWPLEFRLKIDGAYEWLAWAIPVKRAILKLLGKSKES